MTESRYLTFDEQKAAEAAFQGHPCDPQWSPSAREVYDGILCVLLRRCSPSTEMGGELVAASAEARNAFPAMFA